AGRAHAIALGHVLGDVRDLGGGELGAEEGGAVALGEVRAASGAAEATNALGLAGPTVGPDRRQPALAEPGTLGVGAGEWGPIARFHDTLPVGVQLPQQLTRSPLRMEGGWRHHPSPDRVNSRSMRSWSDSTQKASIRHSAKW